MGTLRKFLISESINRNIVECKLCNRCIWFSSVPVLIETLWNVNIICGYFIPCLICINRNIVECKFMISSLFLENIFVLIETLWNVNEYRRMLKQKASRINRNIVECK